VLLLIESLHGIEPNATLHVARSRRLHTANPRPDLPTRLDKHFTAAMRRSLFHRHKPPRALKIRAFLHRYRCMGGKTLFANRTQANDSSSRWLFGAAAAIAADDIAPRR
jgi:hypothetical protein